MNGFQRTKFRDSGLVLVLNRSEMGFWLRKKFLQNLKINYRMQYSN
jgi:hypothetical protein